MFEKSFITDCEGPLTLNDNAFEISAKFIEDGGELFKILRLYDEYLVYIVKKENYKAGNTLKLIISTAKIRIYTMQGHFYTSKGLVTFHFQRTNVRHVQYVSRTVLSMH